MSTAARRTAERKRRAPAGRFPPPSVSLPALLTRGSDREFRRLVDGLVRLSAQIRSIRALLAERLGVTLPQYNLLMALARIEGGEGARMSDVARHLGVTLAFVVVEAGRLQRKGMVRRRRNPADRRSVIVALSPKARAALLRATPYIQRINDRLFRSVAAREMRAVNAFVGRVLEQSDAILRALPRPKRRPPRDAA